jgi:eukaryotic-like serine/threonine-protein kinase
MILCFDEFEFDADNLELRRSGRPVKADTLLLRMLAVLVRRAGQLVTKQELLSHVWSGRAVSDNAVTVAMVRLRRLLGHNRGEREFVVNVHGRGYRFVRPVEQRETGLAPVLTPQLNAPFVGRQRVMKRLQAALDEAREGRGSACMLLGEPGIGKTRAVEVLADQAAELGVPVAWGYCREVGDTPPLWPFAQLVRELLVKVPLDPREPRFAKIVPQLERLLPELGKPAAANSERAATDQDHSAKHRIFDAISRVLSVAAERTACILILDDLHRADPASLELLRYLIDELAGIRIALFATLRTSDKLHPHLNHVLGHRNVARIELERLSRAEVEAYVTSLIRDPNPALAHAVFLKSEGNPFYMTELLRRVRESDRVDLGTLSVPEAALDLVRQRTAMLDDAARGVLSHAAVIGRRFDLPVLQAVTAADATDLMANLDEALARGVVVADPSSTISFAFAHELLRAVLYDALSPRERREAHLLVAQALEQRVAAGDAVPAADLAYHFRAALPASDPRKVVQHCNAAAQEAAHLHAYADATRYVRYARQALDLIEDGSPRLRMRLLLTQALFTQAHSSHEAEPLIRQMIDVARTQRSGASLARAVLLLSPYRGFPSHPDSRPLLEEALALLPDDEPGLRASVLARLATTPPLAYDVVLSSAELAQAQQLADASGDPLAQYSTRSAELYLQGGPDRRREVEPALREIEQLARKVFAMPIQTAQIEFHRAVTALQDGDLVAMEMALERGEANCRHLDPNRLWYLKRLRAVARINAGDRAQGIAVLQALHRRARQQPTPANQLLCAYDQCVVLGDPSNLPRHVLREAFALDPGDPPNIWALKARALAAAGLVEEARTTLNFVPPARLAALPHDRDYLGTLGSLARTAIALGALDYAQALYPLLSPYPDRFAADVSFFSEGRVSELLSLLDNLLGQKPPVGRGASTHPPGG